MATKISAITIGEYLEYVTVLWFDSGRNLPPEDMAEYLPFIQMMQQQALNNGELHHLKLAFEYLLSNPDIDCEQFDGGNYPYNSDEIRSIISLAHKTVWPTSPFPPSSNEVEIVGEYLAGWRLYQSVTS